MTSLLQEGRKGEFNSTRRRCPGFVPDLRYADLRGLDLRGVNLNGTDLRGADLRLADLRGADLRGARVDDVRFGGNNVDLSRYRST